MSEFKTVVLKTLVNIFYEFCLIANKLIRLYSYIYGNMNTLFLDYKLIDILQNIILLIVFMLVSIYIYYTSSELTIQGRTYLNLLKH